MMWRGLQKRHGGMKKNWWHIYGMERMEEKESGWKRQRKGVAAEMWDNRNIGNGVTVSHREDCHIEGGGGMRL